MRHLAYLITETNDLAALLDACKLLKINPMRELQNQLGAINYKIRRDEKLLTDENKRSNREAYELIQRVQRQQHREAKLFTKAIELVQPLLPPDEPTQNMSPAQARRLLEGRDQ